LGKQGAKEEGGRKKEIGGGWREDGKVEGGAKVGRGEWTRERGESKD